MHILIRLRAACCLLLFAGSTLAQELPPPVAAALQRAEIPVRALGVLVQEIGGSKPLLAVNPGTPFNPASTMKLVTSNAALELLGPVYTWKTQAFAAGSQTGEVLQGDLIIKGGGDPKLVLENFWLFLRQIRASGIREIRGDLVLDRTAFEAERFDAAEFDGDPLKPYNAGPDALLLNYGAMGFSFMPDATARTVRVALDVPAAGYAVNPPVLSNGQCGDWQEKLRAEFNGVGVSFRGGFAASCGEKTWHVHPHQMTQNQYFGMVFSQLWRDLGGTLSGAVKNGNLPQDARLLAEWVSPTLSEVIRDMNKFSNNVMARQLFLALSADNPAVPATPQRSAQLIKAWLAGKGIDAPELVLENGSGLSRRERIAAGTMGRMLLAAFQSPLMPEFIASMPLAGLDGTMRKRLNGQGVAGHAHIKTGSLQEVRTLAGYVQAVSGKYYAVVCLINHRNAAAGQAAQDALLQWVYENG
jgi:D-alanyl-D-alanine carboxypeptidase/D-alanyl-D-alanine-endopeptidase (penicillin-binding protein 4)